MEEIRRFDSAVEVEVEVKGEHEHEHEHEQDTSSRLDPPPLATANQEAPPPPPSPGPSRLLSLPRELQLSIWEFAVIEDRPLHINCPCDSSYGGWTDAYYADREAWENGDKHPPWQPPLTRVCRAIRADALPIFYQHNRFQAGYCYETDHEAVEDYLLRIGKQNRELLRHFYFFDGNCRHDVNRPRDLKLVARGKVVRGLSGRLQSTYTDDHCRHDVVFGGEEDGLEGIEKLFGES
ncbi:Hypothetical predicted protein [Lecanosticta acicola]|uniref:2EXR domain-containing protein n=1 Tax=Lecanosticta acicola TaxID=111012 RepID=A0AAI8YSH9_9PEZI|nr:Hypothetical predicted protein [Lecanosticta acicola]